MDWSKLYDDAASAGSNEDVLEDDEQEPAELGQKSELVEALNSVGEEFDDDYEDED